MLDHLVESFWSVGMQHLGGLYDQLESIQAFHRISTFRGYVWLCYLLYIHTRRKYFRRPVLFA